LAAPNSTPLLGVHATRGTRTPVGIPMTPKNRPVTEEEKNLLDSRNTGKKPYQKPEFRSERVFETMALACGKVAVQFQCRRRRRSS
jgi:hypothetical protein